ncbi:Elicitor-responsive protein 3 [Hibiscus syriacus]|uniref:Elicitor-responsive protein 3 n=1 Tax=Hibiscus syriacus TaxID=106335 RepID=A0A6A2YBZ0_HIBSY|nr:Elicitor-responsive protein 3 [Hibiscus syriacus]
MISSEKLSEYCCNSQVFRLHYIHKLFNGICKIPLRAVCREGNIPPTAYNVTRDNVFKGEIKVGLTFTPEGGSSPVYGRDESYGGWKQSSPGRDRHSSDDERDEGRRRGKSHGRRRHSSDED